MNQDLYDTPQKKQQAIVAFTDLLQHPGWQLIEKILLANIEVVRNHLENGSNDPEYNETKADVDRLRDKLKILREMYNTPKDQLKKLEEVATEEVELDPFDTKDSLQAERGAAKNSKP